MASFDRREIVSRRIEYALRSPVVGGEVVKALACAAVDYRRAHGLPAAAPSRDDWLTVTAADDEIVVSLVVESEAPQEPPAPPVRNLSGVRIGQPGPSLMLRPGPPQRTAPTRPQVGPKQVGIHRRRTVPAHPEIHARWGQDTLLNDQPRSHNKLLRWGPKKFSRTAQDAPTAPDVEPGTPKAADEVSAGFERCPGPDCGHPASGHVSHQVRTAVKDKGCQSCDCSRSKERVIQAAKEAACPS